MKIKRNQPCPCGSGKKYKRCCLNKQNIVPESDLAYRRLSKAYEDLEIKLEKFFFKLCGEQGFAAGLEEFFCWPEEDQDEYNDSVLEPMQDLYRPWLLYDWEFDEDNEEIEGLFGSSIAQAYLEKFNKRLSSDEKKLIEGISQKPYCFWEIVDVTQGREMMIENIMTGLKMTVIERMMTTQVNPKDIIFTRAVTVDGVGMLVGTGRTLIPHGVKPALIEIRKDIRGDQLFLTEEDLADWDMELRQYYLDIDRHLHTPPELHNTDGDVLEPHKLIYDIDYPERVFRKMAALCTVESEENLRAESQTDENNEVRETNFPWTKKGNQQMPNWDNTILGEIQISAKRLTVCVNSAKRAKKIRKEIKKRLGKLARLQIDVIEDLDGMMAKRAGNTDESEMDSMTHDELMQVPEAREALERSILGHWDCWLDIPIPALGDETPRNAIKTKDGKEAVEALLYDVIRRTADPLVREMNEEGVKSVCGELGLDFPK